MCACLEKMPVATRSDCTELAVTQKAVWTYNDATKHLTVDLEADADIEFNACDGGKDENGNNRRDNDLESYYRRLVDEGKASEVELEQVLQHLVHPGNCGTAIETFMRSKGWTVS